MVAEYDGLLVLSFGGPDNPDDVMPFLENVTRGRGVPRERLLEVAEHYYHFGGKSPINDQNRELIAELEAELERSGIRMPVYWGNRNWHPLLPDTLRRMQSDGIRNALVLVTSAWGVYSGCRQYREDMGKARAEVGPHAPLLTKIRHFNNHPGFIEAMADRVRAALLEMPEAGRAQTRILFTAHSVPQWMANSPYPRQVQEACNLVALRLKHFLYRQVWQSRSGPPGQPWLEPDILDAIRDLHANGNASHLVIAPIGFISDHMEVVYDLDTEARDLCAGLGIRMVRAATVGTHHRFIRGLRELIEERLDGRPEAAPGPDETPERCWDGCCTTPPPRPPHGGRPTAG